MIGRLVVVFYDDSLCFTSGRSVVVFYDLVILFYQWQVSTQYSVLSTQ